MPDSLITVFERIRAAQDPVVPGVPDLGDVRARARRVHRRRRVSGAVTVTCCLVVVAGVLAQLRPGGDERELVPARPPAGSASTAATGTASTGPSASRSLVYDPPPRRTKNLSVTGFLTADDLAHGDPAVTWQVDEEAPAGDVDTFGLPRCLAGTGALPTPAGGNSHILVDGIGADMSFVATVPQGRLSAREAVLRLDAANETLAADYLRRIAGCTRFEGDSTILETTGSLLVMGTVRPGTATPTDASAILLSDGRLIVIDVSGRPAGTFAVPGGKEWLVATASRAAERAAALPSPGATPSR